jgi:hypothetical protein
MVTAGKESNRGQTPATRLICSYYSDALPLQDFLLNLVQDVRLIESEDEASYQSFVRDSWIGLEDWFERRVFTYEKPSVSQQDVSGTA